MKRITLIKNARTSLGRCLIGASVRLTDLEADLLIRSGQAVDPDQQAEKLERTREAAERRAAKLAKHRRAAEAARAAFGEAKRRGIAGEPPAAPGPPPAVSEPDPEDHGSD